MSKVIRIVPYQATWPEQFRAIVAPLRDCLPSAACFHHIGSTAVPGLAAKDVIDIQLTVETLAGFCPDAIKAAGFCLKPGRVDHLPAGYRLAQAELTKLYFTAAMPAAHLHVRERGRVNQRYALLFRDYLRADAAAAAAYQTAKLALTGIVAGDPAAYYAVKDSLCDSIMAGAEHWARRIDWREPPPD